MSKKTHKPGTRKEYEEVTELPKDPLADLEQQSAELARLREDLTTANLTISRVVVERDEARSKLLDAQQAYSFRHNQALRAEQTVDELKAEVRELNLSAERFRRDVTSLLLHEQFQGGKSNPKRLSEVRARVLLTLAPDSNSLPSPDQVRS